MDLARRIASLGLSARSAAGIKVRQPLAKVLVHSSEGAIILSDDLVEIVLDELNIKDFLTVEEAEQLVSYVVLPNNPLLGPKFGPDFPKVRAALAAADPREVAQKVEAGESVTLSVDGEQVVLSPTEVLVETQAAEGLNLAADRSLTVAVDTVITPELRAEGLAREVVRRVQAQRKNADFNIEDRITTYYQAEGDLAQVFQTWGAYIQAETLTTELVAGSPPPSAHVETHEVDGMKLEIGVLQN
jgi:isoleucyl-tRNA synthetase